MENFTPVSALVGGALIGLSAALLLFLKGRIAGISGIVRGIIIPEQGDFLWRLVFLAGLIAGGVLYQLAGGDVAHIQAVVDKPLIVLGGLIVGIGTTLGSGCTSGHGVCGIARMSPRSIAATLTFMATGVITVFIVRHIIGG